MDTVLSEERNKMNFNGISDEYLLYGYLVSLCNRIQTLGDGEFGDVTMKQHFLLICVGVFDGPPSLGEAAEFMGCTYQNVKRMAAVLEKNGYLCLEKDKKDHRRQILRLTDRAFSFQEQYRKTTEDFMERMYRAIDPQDIRTTVRTIYRMQENLNGKEQESAQRQSGRKVERRTLSTIEFESAKADMGYKNENCDSL